MKPKIAALLLTALPLAGCVEDTGGMSDNATPPQGMEARCIYQAAGVVNTEPSKVFVESRIETGGGPLITLNADGAQLSCRQEADGSVTVFSEFAN